MDNISNPVSLLVDLRSLYSLSIIDEIGINQQQVVVVYDNGSAYKRAFCPKGRKFGLDVPIDNFLNATLKRSLFALFIESTLTLDELFLICAPCSLGHWTFLLTLNIYRVLTSQRSCDNLEWSGMKLANTTTWQGLNVLLILSYRSWG